MSIHLKTFDFSGLPGSESWNQGLIAPQKLIASWPVSRVLYGSGVNRNVAAIPLGQRSHAASRNPPGWLAWKPAGRPFGLPRHPYSVLLPVGFTVPFPLPEMRWALTPPFHPYLSWQAVCFLWHFPWGRPRRTLSGTVFPWSPDFPHPTAFRHW